jgi:hypothetical protein
VTPLELAISLWPELADLRHLDGWTWQRGEGQGLLSEVGLCGYRQISPMWMDVLWIFGPADAHAIRAMVGGSSTWEKEGTAADVLTALTLIPHPGRPGAPLTAPNTDVHPIRP